MEDQELDLASLPQVEDTPLGRPPLVRPRSRKKVWLLAERQVVEYFQRQGPDWQERMATVLKHYVTARMKQQGSGR